MFEATSDTARLPSTGPRVQKPMAAPRRCWGEKSRTSAGVATSTIPSKNPTTATAAPKLHLVVVLGIPKHVTSPTIRSPTTTMLARPIRSATDAISEATAPDTLLTTTTVR